MNDCIEVLGLDTVDHEALGGIKATSSRHSLASEATGRTAAPLM